MLCTRAGRCKQLKVDVGFFHCLTSMLVFLDKAVGPQAHLHVGLNGRKLLSRIVACISPFLAMLYANPKGVELVNKTVA